MTATNTTTKPRRRKTAKAKVPTPASAGLLASEFRARYREHGGSCGDDLANRLATWTRGDDGRSDTAKLRRLAEANGVWNSKYATLNPGQIRMNVGNRLRALVRNGGTVIWSPPAAKRARKGVKRGSRRGTRAEASS